VFALEAGWAQSPIALGFEGSIWYGEVGNGYNTDVDGKAEETYIGGGVGRISPLGLITGDFRNPSRASQSCGEPTACARMVGGVALAPDHDIWFTEHGFEDYGTSFIGRVTTFGAMETFPISLSDPLGRNPEAIALGSDGNMWFLNPDSEPFARAAHTSAIGRVTPSGEITEFPLPEKEEPFGGIVQGSDGNMWFLAGELLAEDGSRSRSGRSSIGYITPSGKVSLIPLPGYSNATSIAAGPDGDVWFIAAETNQIGKVTPGGVITEYPVPEVGFGSVIAPGPDGNMWFTVTSFPDALGRITPEGDVTTFFSDVPRGFDSPRDLIPGNDGTLWFTAGSEQEGSKLVHYAVPYVPAVETLPAITGDPIVGHVLETSDGIWAHSPTAFAYQWLSCDAGGTGCAAIPGDTSRSYSVGQGDMGRTLRVAVTATGLGGSAQAQSAPTAVVQSPSVPTRVVASGEESPVLPTTIGWSFSAARKFTKVLALQLRSLPADSSIEVLCAVHACTFDADKAHLSGYLFRCRRHSCRAGPLRHARRSLTLTPLFHATRLPVGTRLTVRVERPGWQGKLFAFTVLTARDPRTAIDCLSSSGASHPC
jgi:streptogramin lyase